MKNLYLLSLAICLFFGGLVYGQLPTVSINNPSEIEGNPMSFVITLSSTSTTEVVIDLTTSSGTAGTNDYQTFVGTVIIPPDTPYISLPLYTIQDNIGEMAETFTLNGTITSVNTSNIDISGIATIIDNDASTFIIANSTGSEGAVCAFDVILSNPSSIDTFFSVMTTSGSAGATDYNSVNAAVIIPAGYLGSTISVPLLIDNISCEGDETFNLTAICTSGNTLNFSTVGTGTIVDVSGATSASITSPNVTEGDTAVFVITLSNACSLPTIFNLNLVPNSADASDYGILFGTSVVIPAGAISASIAIPTVLDNNVENCETFILIATQNGTILEGTATICDAATGSGFLIRAFIDTNGNGVQESSEYLFTNGQFQYTLNGGAPNLVSTSTGSHFIAENNITNVYNFSYFVNPQNGGQFSTTTTFNNITYNGTGQQIYNFPISVLPFNDLQVVTIASGIPPRPGFIYSNDIYFSNLGSTTLSGTINFVKDNAVSIANLPSGAVLTANGFTYDFTNLLPYQNRTISVYLQVPTIPTVSLGQFITNSSSISTTTSEISYTNNQFTLSQAVVGSYDPNDKTESHGGEILFSSFNSNDFLNYTIRFENTGTFMAENVRINDMLDAKLDQNTIRTITASHPYAMRRTGSTVNWDFNGINLPISQPNSMIGHGFVTFEIKPKTGYAVNDIIPNTAGIYFDFNPPIITNTCNSKFVATLSNNSFEFTKFEYYPNPIKNSLLIKNDATIKTVTITNLIGQTVLTKTINDLQSEIDLSNLKSGIYIMKVAGENAVLDVKIVKE